MKESDKPQSPEHMTRLAEVNLNSLDFVWKSKSGRRLVWFRTQAFQACDPGFKSRRPHHNSGSNPGEAIDDQFLDKCALSFYFSRKPLFFYCLSYCGGVAGIGPKKGSSPTSERGRIAGFHLVSPKCKATTTMSKLSSLRLRIAKETSKE